MKKIDILYKTVYDKIIFTPKTVKKIPVKNGFFEYYFTDMKKIISWNKKNSLINFKFLNIKMDLVVKFQEHFNELYIQNLLPVSQYLDRILSDGWQSGVISVTEYNLIVLFADFCRKYSNAEKNKNLSDRDFTAVEESFLKIAADPENIKLMTGGLKTILNFLRRTYLKNTDDIEAMVNKVDCFFVQRYYYPSFHDLLLAYNMVFYKRYFEWDDLIENKKRRVIQTDFFDCSKEVFEQIVIYIKNTMDRIARSKKELDEIKWIKSLSDISKIEGPEKMIKYYKDRGHNWEQDADDFLGLLLTLFQDIVQDLEIILFKEFGLMDANENKSRMNIINDENAEGIFSKFKTEFDLAKTKHINIIPPRILLKEYLKSDYPESFFKEPNQKYIYEKILKLFGCIRELAMIFKENYYTADKENGGNERLQCMITDPEAFQGRLVHLVFQNYTELFMQILGFFKDRQIEIKIRKFNQLIESIKLDENRLKTVIGSNENVKTLIKEFRE